MRETLNLALCADSIICTKKRPKKKKKKKIKTNYNCHMSNVRWFTKIDPLPPSKQKSKPQKRGT